MNSLRIISGNIMIYVINFLFMGSSGEFGDLPLKMVPEELSGGFGFGTRRLICFVLVLFLFWPVDSIPEELSGGFGFGTGRLIYFFFFR